MARTEKGIIVSVWIVVCTVIGLLWFIEHKGIDEESSCSQELVSDSNDTLPPLECVSQKQRFYVDQYIVEGVDVWDTKHGRVFNYMRCVGIGEE